MKWKIPAPKHSRKNGIERIECKIMEKTIWFETQDAELFPSPEAFAGLMLIPALHHNASIETELELDEIWIKNTKKLLPIYNRWWQYPTIYPIHSKSRNVPEHRLNRLGLCFSGGIDSFYSLIQHQNQTEDLIFIHGYDIKYDDEEKMKIFEPKFRKIAENFAKKSILLRSNLREHQIFNSVNWICTHGAGLVAVGLLLSKKIGKLLIAPSYKDNVPCGTNWETDKHWTSSYLEIISDDASLNRFQKISIIGSMPILRDNLRVCWQNKSKKLNCSRCEKCLRTMIMLEACGKLENYTVLDNSLITDSLVRLRILPNNLLGIWKKMQSENLKADIKYTIRKLLRHSCFYWKSSLSKGKERLKRLYRKIRWAFMEIFQKAE